MIREFSIRVQETEDNFSGKPAIQAGFSHQWQAAVGTGESIYSADRIVVREGYAYSEEGAIAQGLAAITWAAQNSVARDRALKEKADGEAFLRRTPVGTAVPEAPIVVAAAEPTPAPVSASVPSAIPDEDVPF